MHEMPSRAGLYDPRFEHDACGVGFIADLNNVRSHEIVKKGIEILINLDHRGARGAEKETGDGAGILVQLPHAFLFRECSRLGIALPGPGEYAVGQCFLPKNPKTHVGAKHVFRRALDELGRLAFPMGLPPRPDWWSEEVVRANTAQRVRSPRSRRKRRRRSASATPGEGGGPSAP